MTSDRRIRVKATTIKENVNSFFRPIMSEMRPAGTRISEFARPCIAKRMLIIEGVRAKVSLA